MRQQTGALAFCNYGWIAAAWQRRRGRRPAGKHWVGAGREGEGESCGCVCGYLLRTQQGSLVRAGQGPNLNTQTYMVESKFYLIGTDDVSGSVWSLGRRLKLG